MCRPEGTLVFIKKNLNINEELAILKQVSGNHIFQIIHTKQNELLYYYSSPGTNTRVASINLPNDQSLIENIKITITWSPTDIVLYAGNSKRLISAKGKNSPIHFQVDSEGNIIQIGDIGVEVKEVRIISNNKLVLSPSAINTWKDTIDVLETLKSGESKLGYIYSVAIANVSIVTLVSGFETYLKKRFIEIADEGYKFNKQELLDYFRKKYNYQEPQNFTLKELIDKTKPNFQNWEISKDLYNKAYGLKFGEITSSSSIEEIKRCLNFRHRLIHVSLNIDMVNELNVPPEKPIFSPKYLPIAKYHFNEFIQKLHDKTLKT